LILFETARLYVRRFTETDTENLLGLYGNPQVMEFIRPVMSRRAVMEMLQSEIAGYRDGFCLGRFAVIEKLSGAYIGNFVLRESDAVAGVEAGYAFLPGSWGKGYATELLREALEFAFVTGGLAQVFAITDMLNTASQKVLVKCGFGASSNIYSQGKEVLLFCTGNPYPLETGTVKILPLSSGRLMTYLEGNSLFEKEIGLPVLNRVVGEVVKDRMEKLVLPRLKKLTPRQQIFYTFWIVIDSAIGAIVAELGFKGPPGKSGEIEIGYGTLPEYQGKGYMTAAVGRMIAWAEQQQDINAILAETHYENKASIRVVQQNGFLLFDRKGDMLWWRRDTKPV
jgi:ribosomal-protein-alanine N-acetyltransferase